MKSRLFVPMVALVAVAAGFLVGRWHAGVSWNPFFEHYIHLRESNAIRSYVRALTYFREGKQDDALMVLETQLDGALITFVTYDRVPPARREEFVPRAIGIARDYRSKHPWKSSSGELDLSIQKILETIR